jgi:hypothetical protein
MDTVRAARAKLAVIDVPTRVDGRRSTPMPNRKEKIVDAIFSLSSDVFRQRRHPEMTEEIRKEDRRNAIFPAISAIL